MTGIAAGIIIFITSLAIAVYNDYNCDHGFPSAKEIFLFPLFACIALTGSLALYNEEVFARAVITIICISITAFLLSIIGGLSTLDRGN